MTISNLRFSNNNNNNKLNCGNIQFNNDITVNIENSEFKQNHCKSNGGAM